MKTLYIDCGMGAAGDMLTAALLELIPDPDGFIAELNGFGLERVHYARSTTVKCGVQGTSVSVKVDGVEESEQRSERKRSRRQSSDDHRHEHHSEDHRHEHHYHRHHQDFGMARIRRIASGLTVSDRVKKDIVAVYTLIAEAESAVHGVSVPEIHFHEVGSRDAIADVMAVSVLMERLAPDEVVVSPVCTGSGDVKCEHGTLPVPAPATARILKGVPIYSGSIRGELCTPTGAALLVYFADRFGEMPLMEPEAVGYGMGKRDYERANCVRAILGETGDLRDTVSVLSCCVDDMTAEDIGFAMDRLYEGGAREVYTAAIGMKKNRPGTLIRVICSTEDRERMAGLLFRHTTTLGVREAETARYILNRTTQTRDTPFGAVRVKISSGYGVTREKPEYDDLARIAGERGISLAEVRALLKEDGR